MKTRNKNTLFIFLITLFASSSFLLSVYAISFIGSINYIATHGGIVQFSQTFQADRLTYANGLNHFAYLVWGGDLRGNVGFDADTNVNLTVTGITRDVVSYTITTALPGDVQTYLYYYRHVSVSPSLSEPVEVSGGSYTYAGGVTTITTSGSPVDVSVTYGAGSGVSSSFVQAQSMLIALMSFMVLVTAISDISKGTFGMGTVWKSVMLIAILGALSVMFRGWGY